MQQVYTETQKMLEVSVAAFLAASPLGELHIPTWKFKFPLGNVLRHSEYQTHFKWEFEFPNGNLNL